jgi:hypothetical protein
MWNREKGKEVKGMIGGLVSEILLYVRQTNEEWMCNTVSCCCGYICLV